MQGRRLLDLRCTCGSAATRVPQGARARECPCGLIHRFAQVAWCGTVSGTRTYLRSPRDRDRRRLGLGGPSLPALSRVPVAKPALPGELSQACAGCPQLSGLGPGLSRLVTRVRLPSPGAAPALPGYLPDPSGTGVRVGGTRGEGAEVSGAQVVIADQLQLAVVRLVRAHAAIVARLTGVLACPPRAHGLPSFCLAGLRAGDVFVPGPRMRVMPCRVLAHGFLPLPAA